MRSAILGNDLKIPNKTVVADAETEISLESAKEHQYGWIKWDTIETADFDQLAFIRNFITLGEYKRIILETACIIQCKDP